MGISFYTFATMSYTLDVYLRRAAPAQNLLDYALFVTFFPHLVAGPIMRPTELVPQFAQPRRAPGHAGERQRREGHADDIDKDRGRAVGARQVTLQHAHIKGQPVAFEMRGPQLDNDIVGRKAILAEH